MNTIAEDESITGPLGSVFHRIRVPPSLVPELAHMDWNKLGKRVMIDPVDGRISWISPDFTHESGTRAADKIVLPAGIALGEETTEGGGESLEKTGRPDKYRPGS